MAATITKQRISLSAVLLFCHLALHAQGQSRTINVSYKFRGPKTLEVPMNTCLTHQVASFKKFRSVSNGLADYILDSDGSVGPNGVAVAFRVLLEPSKGWNETHFDPTYYDQVISRDGSAFVLKRGVIREKTIQAACVDTALLFWSATFSAESKLAK